MGRIDPAEPIRQTTLGQVTVILAGTVRICTVRLVGNYITLQTPDRNVFNESRRAIDDLPISFAL